MARLAPPSRVPEGPAPLPEDGAKTGSLGQGTGVQGSDRSQILHPLWAASGLSGNGSMWVLGAPSGQLHHFLGAGCGELVPQGSGPGYKARGKTLGRELPRGHDGGGGRIINYTPRVSDKR